MAITAGSAVKACYWFAATRTARVLFAMQLLAAVSLGCGFAQSTGTASPSTTQASSDSGLSANTIPAKADAIRDGKAPPKGEVSAQRAKLLADTHLLLTLSRELQAEAATNTPNTFSLQMVKKSEEIQKLAAAVRAEMEALR